MQHCQDEQVWFGEKRQSLELKMEALDQSKCVVETALAATTLAKKALACHIHASLPESEQAALQTHLQTLEECFEELVRQSNNRDEDIPGFQEDARAIMGRGKHSPGALPAAALDSTCFDDRFSRFWFFALLRRSGKIHVAPVIYMLPLFPAYQILYLAKCKISARR